MIITSEEYCNKARDAKMKTDQGSCGHILQGPLRIFRVVADAVNNNVNRRSQRNDLEDQHFPDTTKNTSLRGLCMSEKY